MNVQQNTLKSNPFAAKAPSAAAENAPLAASAEGVLPAKKSKPSKTPPKNRPTCPRGFQQPKPRRGNRQCHLPRRRRGLGDRRHRGAYRLRSSLQRRHGSGQQLPLWLQPDLSLSDVHFIPFYHQCKGQGFLSGDGSLHDLYPDPGQLYPGLSFPIGRSSGLDSFWDQRLFYGFGDRGQCC